MLITSKHLKRPNWEPPATCQKCNSTALYHDYDPRNFHNGYTCGMCGTEQAAPTRVAPMNKERKSHG